MAIDRRKLIKGGAIAPVAVAACAPVQNEKTNATNRSLQDQSITVETIAEAEKLQGVSYTDAQRTFMLDKLEGRLAALASLRSTSLENSISPAVSFTPRLRRFRVRSQKNTVTLAGSSEQPFPDNAEDIAYATVAELGAWLRRGLLTSEALSEIYLERIGRLDARLHAFITVTPELALEQARKADRELQAGRDRGPLHGIPYGLKDLFDVKGVRTTWGAAPYADRIADEDAAVYEKLKRAGAVLLGKTSCGALAYGDQWYQARTNNPWNVREGSSGSSAGSAAATAAGLCGFSIGTETLGSIISPSERCGLAGLRPTFGRVSRAGSMALCWSLDKVGPICRSVEDTALVLAAVNGYDADDPGTGRVGFTYDGGADLSAMTVAYAPDLLADGDDTDARAFEALKSLGVSFTEFQMPEIDTAALYDIVNVEAGAAFADLALSPEIDQLTRQDDEAWPTIFRAARFVSAVDYVQMQRLRRTLMEQMAAAFEGVDAYFGPHFAGNMLLATNLTGAPQLTVPAGFAQTPNRSRSKAASASKPIAVETARTPRCVSLWGNIYQDGKIIALGRALEAALGASSERPPGF
ncbi:MAG: amidase [Pseudomonadota bacterium]